MDLTRNIQRKKEKELAALQFVGGETLHRASSRCSRKERASAATIPARAAAERSTRNAAELEIGSCARRTVFAAARRGAFFPDQIGDFREERAEDDLARRTSRSTTNTVSRPPSRPSTRLRTKKHFTATAWRLRDSTGAMALFEPHRPLRRHAGQVRAACRSTPRTASFSPTGTMFSSSPGRFRRSPNGPTLYTQLPQLEQSPLPALLGFLPQEGLIPIRNATSWVRFPWSASSPGSRPRWRRFHLGAEAQFGKYKTPKGVLTLAIFNYPTPNMARERAEEFQKIPGAVAKRTGPLVAVISEPARSRTRPNGSWPRSVTRPISR